MTCKQSKLLPYFQRTKSCIEMQSNDDYDNDDDDLINVQIYLPFCIEQFRCFLFSDFLYSHVSVHNVNEIRDDNNSNNNNITSSTTYRHSFLDSLETISSNDGTWAYKHEPVVYTHSQTPTHTHASDMAIFVIIVPHPANINILCSPSWNFVDINSHTTYLFIYNFVAPSLAHKLCLDLCVCVCRVVCFDFIFRINLLTNNLRFNILFTVHKITVTQWSEPKQNEK